MGAYSSRFAPPPSPLSRAYPAADSPAIDITLASTDSVSRMCSTSMLQAA